MPNYTVSVTFRTEWTQDVLIKAPSEEAAKRAVGWVENPDSTSLLVPRVPIDVYDICHSDWSLGYNDAIDLDWTRIAVSTPEEAELYHVDDVEEYDASCYFIVDEKGEEVDDG